jgi:hypothetical protein
VKAALLDDHSSGARGDALTQQLFVELGEVPLEVGIHRLRGSYLSP